MGIILVCCKSDLRDDAKVIAELSKSSQTPISKAQGDKTCSDIKAAQYIECSAFKGTNVRDVFEAATTEALKKQGWQEEEGLRVALSFGIRRCVLCRDASKLTSQARQATHSRTFPTYITFPSLP